MRSVFRRCCRPGKSCEDLLGRRLGACRLHRAAPLPRRGAARPPVARRPPAHDGHARPHLERPAPHQRRHRRRSVENKGDGLFLSQADRYALTDEFLTVYRALLAGETVNFRTATYYRRGRRRCCSSRCRNPARRCSCFGGSSDAGIDDRRRARSRNTSPGARRAG